MLRDGVNRIYWICHERPLHNYSTAWTYIEGVPDDFDFVENNSVIVLDDLMEEARQCSQVTALFTKVSHHKKVCNLHYAKLF